MALEGSFDLFSLSTFTVCVTFFTLEKGKKTHLTRNKNCSFTLVVFSLSHKDEEGTRNRKKCFFTHQYSPFSVDSLLMGDNEPSSPSPSEPNFFVPLEANEDKISRKNNLVNINIVTYIV